MPRSADLNVKNYYEQYWIGIGEYSRGLGPRTLRALETQIRLTSHVLEVGCGPGCTVGRWSVGRCAEYIGVDISENAVRDARKLGLDARVVEDACCLPFDDSSFDVVICLEVLEHLFQPHLAAREMLRVLRPGGVLIATVPNLIHWRHRLLFLRGGWDPGGDPVSLEEPWRDPHIRFFTVQILGRMLKLVGFTRVCIVGEEPERLRRIPLIRRLSVNPRYAGFFPTSLSRNLVAIGFKQQPAAKVHHSVA